MVDIVKLSVRWYLFNINDEKVFWDRFLLPRLKFKLAYFTNNTTVMNNKVMSFLSHGV